MTKCLLSGKVARDFRLTGQLVEHEGSLVERLQVSSETAERLRETDGHVDDEVVAAPRVDRMLQLVHHDDDVARLKADLLVAFAVEGDLVPVLHALLNVNLDGLFRFDLKQPKLFTRLESSWRMSQ